MAYNLNYNPGTEYDKAKSHRKIIVVLIIILILITLGIVFWINFSKNSEDVGNSSGGPTITTEEKERILSEIPTSTPVADEKKVSTVNQVNQANSSEPTVSNSEKEDILRQLNKQ